MIIDSGDLSYLSKEARKLFVQVGEKFGVDYFKQFTIVASNDLSEHVLMLKTQLLNLHLDYSVPQSRNSRDRYLWCWN